MWRRLNYIMSKSYGRSARIVSEISGDGVVTEHKGQDKVKNTLWLNIHDKRLITVKQAPVCQERLRRKFGYQAVSKSAKDVLDGTYDYAIDFDQSTKELMQERERIRQIIPPQSVDIRLRQQLWQNKSSPLPLTTCSARAVVAT